ncbi:MAG: TFIIB-type zinc ribbon-containing protein [Desulfurococcales archaeon]|nr:TFIIB-type zinc ribbon-containing protein [Desulfurococcales archaeon]
MLHNVDSSELAAWRKGGMTVLHRCPYCGSERLVWDHDRGYIVCASCGAIIEELIEDDAMSDEVSVLPVYRTVLVRSTRRSTVSAGKTVECMQQSLTIKTNHKEDIKIYEYEISDILKIINKNYKISNSSVAKAIAYYIVATLLGYSKRSALEFASNKSNISRSYLIKILRSLQREVRETTEALGELIARENRERLRKRLESLRDCKEAARPNLR